jgi:hypothetical protein
MLTVSLYAADIPTHASKYPITLATLGSSGNNVLGGGSPLTSMFDIFSVPQIDYADVHLYTSTTQANLAGIWSGMNANSAAIFLEEISTMAAGLGKPLLVSEFGVGSRTSPGNLFTGPWVEKSHALLTSEMGTILNWAYAKNIDGIMPWGIQFDFALLLANHSGTWSAYKDQIIQADYNTIFVTPEALADGNSVLNLIRNYTTLFTQ